MFLAFISITLLGFLWLMFDRWALLRSENELDGLLSREAGFLFNNVIFLGIAFATFWGTIFPMISELVVADKIAVSAPFFNKVNGPIFLALLILMGVGPLLGWRRSTMGGLRRNFTWPIVFALGMVVLLTVTGVRDPSPLVVLGACAFVTGTIGQEFYRGAHARRTVTGESWWRAAVGLMRRNQRRYGGYIVHLGIVLVAVGITGQSFFQSDAQGNLAVGESMQVGPYTLTYQGLSSRTTGTHEEVFANLLVSKNGKPLGTLHPSRNLYFKNPDQPTSEVGLKVTLTEDLYTVLAGWEKNGATASFKAYVNPLMVWMWIGGLVLMLGTVVAVWPHGQRQRATVRSRASREVTQPAG
ncbi:MAG TPA: hypothetical protein EYP04_00995 [Anaerolineae bacterium]|nr:hypothetical protein [Anaerolineae bacterium]